MTPQKCLQMFKLTKIGVLWVWKNLWGYGRKVHAKVWSWGTPWDPSYDHFCVLGQTLKLLILKILMYMQVYGPWEVSHLFSREIARRMPFESCLGTPWGPIYEHICKNVYFKRGRFG